MYNAKVLEESGRVDEDILGKVGNWKRDRLTENKMSWDDVWK